MIRTTLAAALLAAATFTSPTVYAAPITEDDPAWSCIENGNRICGPGNTNGVPAGCYNDLGALVSAWPCHVVVDPATGEGDVYTGLA